MNKLHRSSINSEYPQQRIKYGDLYRVPSFATTYQHSNSNQDIYINKLEAVIKQKREIVKANKPVLEQLECQRRFFKRICEKQKEKINQIDINVLREEYELQLNELREKRNKMHQMLAKLHEEAQSKTDIYNEISKSVEENHVFLEKSLKQIEAENAQYQEMLKKKNQILKYEQQRMQLNAGIIDEKERIQQKYKLIKEEIERRESKY